MLLRESGLLGEDAGDGQHSQATIFDLRYGISLLLLGIFAEA